MFKINKSVAQILAGFQTVLNDLADAEKRLLTQAENKNVEAAKLSKEAEEHKNEAAQANAAFAKISALISQ